MQAKKRGKFLGGAATAFVAAARAFPAQNATAHGLDFPLVDYHIHLTPRFSLEDAVALSKERGVKFGIAEHAGAKENQYTGILTNDQELRQWNATPEGTPGPKAVK